MSKPILETFATTSDILLRVFAILAAISAAVYLLSSWQLQRVNRTAAHKATLEGEQQHSDMKAGTAAAQKKLEQLQSENLRLSAELQKEQQLRIQTQRRFGPRLIGPEKTAAMVDILRPYAGQKINFAYFAELETAAFGERLLDIVKSAGWKPQVFKLKNMQPVYGIACGGPNPNDEPLRALTQALEIADKHTTIRGSIASVLGQGVQPEGADQLWVVVGLKRPHVKQHDQGASPQSDEDSKNQ